MNQINIKNLKEIKENEYTSINFFYLHSILFFFFSIVGIVLNNLLFIFVTLIFLFLGMITYIQLRYWNLKHYLIERERRERGL